jgi:hypothetical protein
MPSKPKVKRVHVRYVQNETKFSVGEYVNAKWRNIVDPFKVDDREALGQFLGMIKGFLLRNKDHGNVALVSYQGGEAAKALADKNGRH